MTYFNYVHTYLLAGGMPVKENKFELIKVELCPFEKMPENGNLRLLSGHFCYARGHAASPSGKGHIPAGFAVLKGWLKRKTMSWKTQIFYGRSLQASFKRFISADGVRILQARYSGTYSKTYTFS